MAYVVCRPFQSTRVKRHSNLSSLAINSFFYFGFEAKKCCKSDFCSFMHDPLRAIVLLRFFFLPTKGLVLSYLLMQDQECRLEILGACQEQDMKGLENSKEVSKVVFGSSLRIDLMHRVRLRFRFLKGLTFKLFGCHIDNTRWQMALNFESVVSN